VTTKVQDDRSGLLTRLIGLGARTANPPEEATKQPRRGNYSVPPHRQNRKSFTVWLDRATIVQIKQIAAEQDKTHQDLAIEAYNLLFHRYGKGEIAF
jgi:Antitoxin-like ribbon-helix-helix